MRRAAALLPALLLATAACSRDENELPATDAETGEITAPVSPGTAPNDQGAEYPPPQPNPLGGDSTGMQATPGTDTRGAVAPGTQEMPSTPPTLPQDRPPPAPVTSPR